MKNLRYFPHERNVYFKGKLLTVRDFESEQRYFNDKRRLTNRLLHGGGVVCGLQVIAVDEKQISVEAGVALDYLGREIVLPEPVKLKLSMMEGFSNNDYAKNVYVCLAYDEKGKEQVFSVSETVEQEMAEYNRVAEGYRLFIKEEAPHPASIEGVQLVEHRVLLYADPQVRIWQATPRYVNPGEVFSLQLHIEKTVQTSRVQFQYKLDAPGLTVMESSDGSVSFLEPVDAKETDYVVSIPIKAGWDRGTVELAVLGGKAEVRLGDRLLHTDLVSVGKIEITPDDLVERLVSDYYSRKLDQVTHANEQPFLYLAKVCLLQMNATYVIEKVVPVPFGEYVYTPAILQKLALRAQKGKPVEQGSDADSFRVTTRVKEIAAGDKPQFDVSYDNLASVYQFELGLPRPGKANEQVATGVVEIPIEPYLSNWPFGVKIGNRYFSEELKHSLGKGNVYVSAGIEDFHADVIDELLSQHEQVMYGHSSVFDDSEYATDAAHFAVGVIVYPQKGTFRIGVQVKGPVQTDRVRIRWWAIKPLAAGTEDVVFQDSQE